MGVSLHYRGRLRCPDLIDPFIREVTDIAASLEWECDSFDTIITPDDENVSLEYLNFWRPAGWTAVRLRGLFVSPHPQSEPLRFLFDPEGRLIDLLDIQFGTPPFAELPWLFTKTQYAGPQTHVDIVGLLKYLETKYFGELHVADEGTYWETGDLGALKARMGLIAGKLRQVGEALDGLPKVPDEPAETTLDRIEAVLRRLADEGSANASETND